MKLGTGEIQTRDNYVTKLLLRITESTLKFLLKHWLGLLIKHRYIEALFTEASVVTDLEHLPESFIVSREASLIVQKLVTSRCNVKESTKKTGIDFVVSVAKRCSLRTQNHCDVTILTNATSCHFNFAKKVLQAINQVTNNRCTYITLNVMRSRQLTGLRKSARLFWMSQIVDQSQERCKFQ